MAITKTSSRSPCPLFAGRGLVKPGFTMALPYKTYLSCEPSNISAERSLLTVFNYDLAEYVKNQGADIYAFGIYAETGAETDAITTAKHIYAFKCFLKVTEDYSLGSGQRHNADVRAASIVIEATDSVSGVVHGMYLNTRLRATSGGSTFGGYYLAHTATYGGIGLEVRTEVIGESAETTTIGASAFGYVGILLAHKSNRQMTGEYAAMAIHVPLETVAIVGATTGIRFDTAGIWSGTAFDIGIDFEDSTTVTAIDIGDVTTGIVFTGTATTGIDFNNETTTAINIDGCTMALDADVTLTAATNAANLNVTSTAAQTTGYNQVLQVTMTHSGDITGTGECHGIAIDMTITGDVPYLFCETYYITTSGNPTLGFVSGLSMYMDNCGTGVGNLMILDLQMAHSADDPDDRYGFIRMRSHNATYQTKYAIMLEGNNGAENLLRFDAAAGGGMLTSGSDSTNCDYKIAVEIQGAGTRYFHLFTD